MPCISMPSRFSRCILFLADPSHRRAVRSIAMPLLIPSSRTIRSPCHRPANHPAHLRSNPLLRGLRRPCPSIAKLLRSLPYHATAAPRRSGLCCTVSALRAAIRLSVALRFAQAVRCFALSLPSPRRALPQTRASWPCSSFANAASQIYAFPWRVSSSLIHGHAPLAELILCNALLCFSFAMQCLSVPSRLVSKLCRSVSRPRRPNLRGPTPQQIGAAHFHCAPEERLTAPPESRM